MRSGAQPILVLIAKVLAGALVALPLLGGEGMRLVSQMPDWSSVRERCEAAARRFSDDLEEVRRSVVAATCRSIGRRV